MSETIRRLVGEEIFKEHFEEMSEKIGDKRPLTHQTETKKMMPDKDSFDETRKKTKFICKPCGKLFTQVNALYRHKKHYCKARLPTLKLEWNGDRWMISDNRYYYRLQLGQNLFNLIEKGAIKEDVLNCTQKEYLDMYKKLFSE